MEAQNTLSDWISVSFHKTWKQSTQLNERHSSTALTVICATARESEKLTSQPCGLNLIHQNQPQVSETMVLNARSQKVKIPNSKGHIPQDYSILISFVQRTLIPDNKIWCNKQYNKNFWDFFMFPLLWLWRLLSSEMQCHDISHKFTNILEKLATWKFYPKDWGNRFLWNAGEFLPDYMASHPHNAMQISCTKFNRQCSAHTTCHLQQLV